MSEPPTEPDPEETVVHISASSELRAELQTITPRPSISISKEDVRRVPETALRKPVRIVQVSPVEVQKFSGKAIAALVFGVVGIPLMGILVGPVAIVFGSWAVFETNRSRYLTGRRVAIAGIILGSFDIMLWIGVFLFWGIRLLRKI